MPTLSIGPTSVEEVHQYGLQTTEGSAVIHRRNVYPAGRKHRTRYRLAWDLLTQSEIDSLVSLFTSLRGSGTLDWTPPGGSAGTYRIVEDEISVSHKSATIGTVAMTLEEV